MEIINVEGFGIAPQGIRLRLCPHPCHPLLMVCLDLRDALWLFQLFPGFALAPYERGGALNCILFVGLGFLECFGMLVFEPHSFNLLLDAVRRGVGVAALDGFTVDSVAARLKLPERNAPATGAERDIHRLWRKRGGPGAFRKGEGVVSVGGGAGGGEGGSATVAVSSPPQAAKAKTSRALGRPRTAGRQGPRAPSPVRAASPAWTSPPRSSAN